MNPRNIAATAISIVFLFNSVVEGASKKRTDGQVINLLVDCSHEYSFNLSAASRTQNDIFPGINCLTACQTIHKLDLEPINALVVLMDGKMPYHPKDAPYLLNYVKRGGGLYIGARTGGAYGPSLKQFLSEFGLKDEPVLSKDPKNWGISAHAPSELVYELDGKCKRFTSTVGMWKHGGGSVTFEVYGDEKLLHQTGVLRGRDREEISVDVKGVQALRLVATDAGNGNSSDGSVWFDPRIVTTSGRKMRLLLSDAASVKVGWAKAMQDVHFNGEPLGGGKSKKGKEQPPGLYPNRRLSGKPWPTIEGAGRNLPNLTPTDPLQWKTIYVNGKGTPAVMVRKYGRGLIVCDTAGLYGAAISQKEPHVEAMRRLIEYISGNKKVEPVRGGGGWQFSDGYRWEQITTTEDGLRIHYNEYSKMYIESDIKAYKETVKYLTQITGLDETQKASQINELGGLAAKAQLGTPIDIDISGVRTLTLVTTDGGNGNASDHSVFADNFLINSSGRKTKLELEDASEVRPGYGRALQDTFEDGAPLSIGGKTFENGILLHASGRMSFDIDGKYKRFVSHAGCSDRSFGSVGFKVLGDGKELWNDGLVYRGGVPGGNPNDINYVPEGVLFQLKYLPCVGAGFLLPQGSAVDLPPALKDDWQVHLGMLSHEMGHAWGFPFCEKIGEEGSAFIFNNLVLHHHYGQKHGDSVTRRLMGYLKKQDLDGVDLAVTRSDFKYYMFIDLMIREYGEGIWKNYNLLKYALLNKEGAVWDAHSTAWLWSIAAGRDVYPWFEDAFGSNMEKDKVELPKEAMDAGFDPVAVGELYDVPLKALPQQRDIFSQLKSFSDVREFYDKESAEKGYPKVEG